jgi:hypothetical protein
VPDDVALGRLGVIAGLLETLEPRIDSAPARAHEVDEEREVVHTGMSFGEELSLEPLEPPDRLVQQAADLGDVTSDGEYLGPQAVTYGGGHLRWNGGLESGGGRRERLDLRARALERGFEDRRLGTPGRGVGYALLRSLEGDLVHGRQATLSAGWTPRSWSTSFRRS